jgi:hypothetical protein
MSKKANFVQNNIIISEKIANYMSLSSNNYVKDLNASRGLLDINFTDDNWESYKGFFKDGKKHGVGKLKLTNGREFEGEFENGLANGYGILSYGFLNRVRRGFEDKGNRVAGKWKDNMLDQFL